MIEAGQTAPDFELPDQDGMPVRLSGFRGRHVAVYFYPKDDTPGCTKEACSFRDNHAALTERGVVVLGISADDTASHRAFREKYELPFPLLADPAMEVIRAWGAYGEKNRYGKISEGILRYTFLIGPDGIVKRVFKRPKTDVHGEEILAAIGAEQ